MRKVKAKPKGKANPVSRVQLMDMSPQGPMTPWFNAYIFRKIDGNFYEVLREAVPIVDAAINRLTALNGTVRIIGDNITIVKELEDFCLNVPVNDMQTGIQAFMQNHSNEVFEQGFAISEIVSTKDRKDIAGLRVADSKRLYFRRADDGTAEPWYRNGNPIQQQYMIPASIIEEIINARFGQPVAYNGISETKLSMENKLYFSINNENQNPYGVSLLRSLEFVSQVLITIQNNIKSTAERFGDPMYHVHYNAGKERIADLETRRMQIESDFSKIVAAKRKGQSGDLVTAGGLDSKVEINVIGHQGQIMTYDVPVQHCIDQIISKTGLPTWLLGLPSKSTGVAQFEIEAALSDAKVRQSVMLPQYIRLFSTLLKLRGRTWKNITTSIDKAGDFGVIFETPNLRDIVAQAQSRFLSAQADLMASGAAATAQTTGGASFDTAFEINGMTFRKHSPLTRGDKGVCSCKSHEGGKKLNRPKPWPELDKVETDYQSALVYDWRELRDRVLRIVGLESGKGAKAQRHKEGSHSRESGNPEKEKIDTRLKISGMTKEEDVFFFSDEAKAAIDKALKDFLGSYALDNPDSPVVLAYSQAFSLGFIRAAETMGETTPILNIIKNKEVFDEMLRTGFKLLKDNTTVNIKKAIDFMEEGMLQGLNPVQVAADLEKLFDDKNYDWERLARSEMSMAAERAKLNEWGALGVKMVEFTPAPDGCELCFSLAGDYEIDKCPVPVDRTHPNCRCAIQPAVSEVNG